MHTLKYPEIVPMRKTTASETVSVLRTVFARHGLPLQIVSDNGPQFVSEEIRHFLSVNGVSSCVQCAISYAHKWTGRTFSSVL